VAAAALNAGLETAGLNLLPVYPVNLGSPEKSATILLTILLTGSIVLQLPIGLLGDRMSRVPCSSYSSLHFLHVAH